MTMRVLLCLACLLRISSAAVPGAVITLEQAGINYAAEIGRQVADNKLVGLHIPDISGVHAGSEAKGADGMPVQFDLFSYKLSSIVITKFAMPAGGLKAGLSPPSNIALSAGGLVGEITGHYEIKVGSGWFSVSKSGGVTISMSGASLHQNAAISTVSGKPHLSPGSCSASAGNLDITFHGDLIDDIINLFKSDIAGYVSGKIPPAICGAVKSLVSDDANKELAGIPTKIDLGNNYFLDYSFTQNPAVHGSDISIYSLAKFYYGSNENGPGYPLAHPLKISTGNGKMLCVAIDPNEIGGSAANAAMLANLMHYDLTAATLKQFKVSPTYLNCNCSGTCLGKMLPPIQKLCNGAGVASMNLKETTIPTIAVNSTGAYVSLQGDLTITGHMPGQAAQPLLVSAVTVSAVVPASLQFQGWTIKGEVDVTGATLAVKQSFVGPIDGAGLEQLWQIGLLAVVNGELNSVAKKGITLPAIPYVDVQNPVLAFGDGQLNVCGDIKYTGPTKL